MTLARLSRASATHTPAWAAATTKGLASDSRNAVARLIGKGWSAGSSGAGSSRRAASRPTDASGWDQASAAVAGGRPESACLGENPGAAEATRDGGRFGGGDVAAPDAM